MWTGARTDHGDHEFTDGSPFDYRENPTLDDPCMRLRNKQDVDGRDCHHGYRYMCMTPNKTGKGVCVLNW